MKKLGIIIIGILISVLPIFSFNAQAQHIPDPQTAQYKWYTKRLAGSESGTEVLVNEVKAGTNTYNFLWGPAFEYEIKFYLGGQVVGSGNPFEGKLWAFRKNQGSLGTTPDSYRSYYFAVTRGSQVVGILKYKEPGDTPEWEVVIVPDEGGILGMLFGTTGKSWWFIDAHKARSTTPHGPKNDSFGRYLTLSSRYVSDNKPSYASGGSYRTIAVAHAKDCEALFIEPVNREGSPDHQKMVELFNSINESAKGTAFDKVPPLSNDEDLAMYRKYFATEQGENEKVSDRYIYSTNTEVYSNLRRDFQLSERGLAWFWTERTKDLQRNALITIIGGIVTGGFGAVVGGTATAGVNLHEAGVNKQNWKDMARLLYAIHYIRAHVEYDKCIAEKSGDEDFKKMVAEEEDMLKNTIAPLIDQQLKDYLAKQEQSETGYQLDWLGNVIKFLVELLRPLFETLIEWIAKLGGAALSRGY